MFKAMRRAVAKWRRQRLLQRIRREFARCGYPVERVDDAAIEAAFAPGGARNRKSAVERQNVFLCAATAFFRRRRRAFSPPETSFLNAAPGVKIR